MALDLRPGRPLRVAVLVKQIPAFEAMTLGPDGRLVRDGLELEMNAYCRRAVALGTEILAAGEGSLTVITLGPPQAEDVLREAIAWATDRGVAAEGVLLTDPAFAGSDTLATATALALALDQQAEGSAAWDLVLLGRNSVDADTGQVGPELAQMLGLPFAQGVRELTLAGDTLQLRLEHDDEWVDLDVDLPAVLTCAERLLDPAKVPPEARAAVPSERISTVVASDLGEGPWGQAASPTEVGETRVLEVDRLRKRLDGPVERQVAEAVAILEDRGALDPFDDPLDDDTVPASGDTAAGSGRGVAVIVEPGRPGVARELLGGAARLAAEVGAHVTAIGQGLPADLPLSAWGADRVVDLATEVVLAPEEDIAAVITAWAEAERPWAVLAPGTLWGREVASRVAAALGAGLTGDAVGLAVDGGRLLAWKPAFGGMLVAGITSGSPVQIVTVRPGVLGHPQPRAEAPVATEALAVPSLSRVRVVGREREDDVDVLATAEAIVGVGRGVAPDRYAELDPLLRVLGAELAATRKVTDNGWMPRARQIGITGHSVSPRLFVAIGTSGKFNHTVGIRGSGTVLGITDDPDAPLWDHCDVGITATWEEAVPLLVSALQTRL
jgi:electron transfer flavoprotein alpha subunit/electron transfer flavoprotein alpha/beta subunit